MVNYPPTDQWPRHSKSWFREVLKKARGMGWSLETHTNHGTYKLRCPDGRCQLVVFSTGKGGETVAKRYLHKVSRCNHGVADSLEKAADLLVKAERLVEGVFTLHERRCAEARAYQAIDGTLGYEESDIEELLNECERLAKRCDELLGADATDSETALTVANGVTREVEGLLEPLPGRNGDVRQARERLRKVNLRISEARRVLAIS